MEQQMKEWIRNHRWFRVICGIVALASLGILILFWIKEEYASWISVVICGFFLTVGIYMCFFSFFTYSNRERNATLLSLIIALIGILIGIDNSALTQTDDYKKTIKRIFEKENVKDISSEMKKAGILPELVFVLDISGSTWPNDDKYKDNVNTLLAKVSKQFVKLSISDAEKTLKDFISTNGKINYNEYSIYKLKLLDIIAEKQSMYKISIICFGEESVCSCNNNDFKSLKINDVIKFIKVQESNRKSKGLNSDKTNFIDLFNTLSDYNLNQQNTSEMPDYAFVFFSDYIHDSEKTNRKDIEQQISSLYAKQNYVNFFYFDNTDKKENADRNLKKGQIDILSILQELKAKGSKGSFVSLMEDVNLFDEFSSEYIPIYYTQSFSRKELRTKITFNDINKRTINCSVSLDKPIDNIINYHHIFDIYDKNDELLIFPNQGIEIDSNHYLTLSFKGRIMEYFPCCSLNFYCEETNGFMRFDIVFFKDFSELWRIGAIILVVILWFFLISVSFWFISSKKENEYVTPTPIE